MVKINKKYRLTKIFFLSTISSILLGIGPSVSRAQLFDVTTAADSGPGSLREAIDFANGDGVPTSITFDRLGTAGICPVTIAVGSTTGSQLPALTGRGDIIDGSACGVTLIGSALTGSADGIRPRESDITVRGLTIRNFPRNGVAIQPSGATGLTVTNVVISNNSIEANGMGARIAGGVGPGNHVGATLYHNSFNKNGDEGVFIQGSFSSGPGDIGRLASGKLAAKSAKLTPQFREIIERDQGKNKVWSCQVPKDMPFQTMFS